MPRRSSWAGAGAPGASSASRRWSAAAAAVTAGVNASAGSPAPAGGRRWSASAASRGAGSPFLPSVCQAATDVGLTRAIYRESRKVLASQLENRESRRWKLKDVCQAVLKGAKVATQMYKIVELFKAEAEEGRARRAAALAEAEALKSAAAAADAERDAAAEADSEAKEKQGADALSGSPLDEGAQSTMMHNISQVVHQLRHLGAPVLDQTIDEIMRLCKDISSSLTRFADMFLADLEGLGTISSTLDQNATALAGLVGRLKEEMVRLHAALQVASDMQAEALDREAFESSVAERRAEVQATINERRNSRQAWQKHHKDSKKQQELQIQLQDAQQDEVRSKTLAQSEQVINQLDQLQQALLNSPSALNHRTAKTFGDEMIRQFSDESSEGDVALKFTATDDVAEQARAERLVEMSQCSTTIDETKDLDSSELQASVLHNSLPVDVLPERRRSSPSIASEPFGGAPPASLPPPEEAICAPTSALLAPRPHDRMPTDGSASLQSVVGSRQISDSDDEAGKSTCQRPVMHELKWEDNGDRGNPSADRLKDEQQNQARKALQWASSLIEQPKERRGKARDTSSPTTRCRPSTTGVVQDPAKIVANVRAGHWRRVRTPPLVDASEEKASDSRTGSPVPAHVLATIRTGAASVRRPSVPDASQHPAPPTAERRPSPPADVRDKYRGSLQSRQPRSPRPEQPRSPHAEVGVLDLLSAQAVSSQEAPLSARAGCPPRPRGHEQHRRYSAEGVPVSARQPKRPVNLGNSSRPAETQRVAERSPSPEVETVWSEAWNPELGAIGRAQRLQDEIDEEDDVSDQMPRRRSAESRGIPLSKTPPVPAAARRKSPAPYNSSNSAPGPQPGRPQAMSPRLLPPVAGTGVDAGRPASKAVVTDLPTSGYRTAKQADLQAKRPSGGNSGKSTVFRRHPLRESL